MIRAGAIAIGLGLALGAPDAAAFSDPGLFAAPALDGGGAGHQFTGAPGDGLACDVCHRGGPAPAFAIEGVPDELEPGTRYQVVVRWTDPAPHALQLELVDDAGASPAIALPPTAPPRRAAMTPPIRGPRPTGATSGPARSSASRTAAPARSRSRSPRPTRRPCTSPRRSCARTATAPPTVTGWARCAARCPGVATRSAAAPRAGPRRARSSGCSRSRGAAAGAHSSARPAVAARSRA